MAKKTIQADYDVNQDGVVDAADTVEVEDTAPKVYGWEAGVRANKQIHPVTNPYKPADA